MKDEKPCVCHCCIFNVYVRQDALCMLRYITYHKKAHDPFGNVDVEGILRSLYSKRAAIEYFSDQKSRQKLILLIEVR